MGIRSKITIPFLLVFSVLYGGFAWIAVVRVESAVETRLVSRARDMIRVISKSPSLLPQEELLNQISEAVGAELVVFESPDAAVASTFSEQNVTELIGRMDAEAFVTGGREPELRSYRVSDNMFSGVIFPVKNQGQEQGRIAFLYPSEEVEREKEKAIRRLILPGVSGFLLLLVLGIVLGHYLTTPIRKLSQRAKQVVEGEEEIQLKQQRSDEIGDLSRALQDMIDRITEKQKELLKTRTMAAVGQAAGRMAHEIRNPLSSITMNLQMLKKDTGEPPDPELIDAMLSEAERLELILDEFLHMTDPGQSDRQETNIRNLLEDVIRLIKKRAEHRNIEIEMDLEALPEVYVDPGRIKQVFLNLLLNSFEAMPEGGRVMIRASVNRIDGEREVQVDVHDTGTGVPEDLREKIFEPLFSSDANELGLGLSISREILEEHNGQISCLPSEEGAHFRVRIPVASPEEVDEEPVDSPGGH